MEKYYTRARIARISYSAYEGEEPPHEGSLEILVQKEDTHGHLKLNCFIYGATLFALFERKIKEGDLIEVKLVMSNYDYNNPTRLRGRTREISVDADGFYVAKGQIIDLMPNSAYADSDEAVLDCGVFIFVRIKKDSGLRTGDYTAARSRLDAHLLEVANG